MADSATKEDLLGADDNVKPGGTFGFLSGKPQTRSRATVFSLGKRHNLITTDFLSPLIVPHAAQQANETVRLMNRLLKVTNLLFSFNLNRYFVQYSMH